MRHVVAGLTLLVLAGCSRAPDSDEGTAPTADQMVPSTPEPPAVALTAAPGVAFNYRYAFRLPPAAIAGTQETHAAACEKLGIARCRIVGMQYRLLGENNIEAMLAFKLAPEIARAFGRDGIRAVADAKGSLVNAEITGDDAGETIAVSAQQRAQAEEEVRRIDARLTDSARPDEERAALQEQRAAFQRQAEAARAAAASAQKTLATTPMTFVYQSGAAVRGFDTSAPLASALDTMVGSAQFTLAAVLGLLAIFGPPALALFLLWAAWRYLWPQVRWLLTSERVNAD